MQIDPETLRRHYASLSDEALEALDRDELTDLARGYFDEEWARRELTITPEAGSLDAPDLPIVPLKPEGDWITEAACACSFADLPGRSSAEHADEALAVLQAAGIPCQIEMHEVDQPGEKARTYQEYRVMVPAALNLQATSVLDKDVFNSKLEAEWKTYFEALSDAELRAINPDVICAGLRDQIERLTKAYYDEVAQRGQD